MDYVNAHNGINNAYTADVTQNYVTISLLSCANYLFLFAMNVCKKEITNYFFTIDAKLLDQMLPRFASFFISPILAHDSVGKEMRAVDNEHQKNIQNDAWRERQMLKR